MVFDKEDAVPWLVSEAAVGGRVMNPKTTIVVNVTRSTSLTGMPM